jgi:hypothetical protein
MPSKRVYKSGSRFAFWRWTYTPSGYITRLHVIMTPWFAICLHWINKPDAEPHLHDHPVSFLSLLLRGWYRESRVRIKRPARFQLATQFVLEPWALRLHGNLVRASDDDMHRIVEVAPGGALTLCFMGPVRRKWGFHTPDGWVYYKDYNAAKYTADGDDLAPVIAARASLNHADT